MKGRFRAPSSAGSNFCGPNRQNLRSLVHTLEASFGFRNRLDRRYPKMACAGGIDLYRDVLPLVYDAQLRTLHNTAPDERVPVPREFKIPVRLIRREQVEHDFQSHRELRWRRRSRRV